MKKTHRIDHLHDGSSALKFLKKTYPKLSLIAVEKLFRKKEIKRSGKALQKQDILSDEDEVTIFIPQKITKNSIEPEEKKKERTFSKELLKKHIHPIYEDEAFLAMNKQAGISVHTGTKTPYSLEELLRAQYKTPLFLCHRLDRDTSGVLLLSKHGGALRKVLQELREHHWGKEYLCLVFGKVKQKQIVIQAPIDEQKAETTFVLERQFSRYTLLRAFPKTGRKHQIRRHLADIGHPIVLDSVYGDFEANKTFRSKTGLKRQFLHAATLGFVYEKKKIHIAAPLPEDLKKTLAQLS